MSEASLEVRVKSVTYEADRINSYDLRLPAGGELPPFEAGAHIGVRVGGNSTRSYSLVNPPHERHRYVIAVALEEASGSGSRFFHDRVRTGDRLLITPPSNNFALVEDAPHTVLIAGGIGIAPLWCMAQRLAALNRSWALHYAARTRGAAAFVEEIAALRKGKVHLHFDDEAGGQVLDVAAVVNNAPADAHLFACGPAGMLGAFEDAIRNRTPEHVHVEYFKARSALEWRGQFTVVLAKSNARVTVAQGQSILGALRNAGFDPPCSCMQGVCGECVVRVLGGVPDHRDLVLNDTERAANKLIMTCCSGSCSETLVLDL